MIMTVGLIMFAMVSGVAAFLAVSVALGGPPDFGNIANQPLGPLPLMCIALALGGVVMANIIPRIIGANSAQQVAPDSPLEKAAFQFGQIYQLNTIVAAALLEGPGIMGVITFHTQHSAVAFGVAVLMICALLTLFPTPGRVLRWVERQLENTQAEQNSKESF